MKFPCTITRHDDGRWLIRHSSAEVGTVTISAASRDEAIRKMRGEVRYRLELCPCTGAQYEQLEIAIIPD